MSRYSAVDNFDQLVKNMGGEKFAAMDTEKGLLCLGLLNLARGLRHLETEINSLKQNIHNVDAHVKRNR